MEPVSTSIMVGSVVGYLAKKLKDNKSVESFFADFTGATVDWIRPLFLTEDGKNKEIIVDLLEEPTEKLNTDAVENALNKQVRREPELEAKLKALYDAMQAKPNNGGITISHSKNVVTGTIKAGGNVTIGDNNNTGK
jgi:hypothetical protein